MSLQSYRKESRADWGMDSVHGALSLDQIKAGAILRIADATEKMAQRHTDLIRERDSFERMYRHAENCERTLERRLAAAKGQITKLKKRLAIAQTQAFGGDPASVAFKGKEAGHG